MIADPFASLGERPAARVRAACGHVVDPRTLVYWHCPHGVTALCKDCGPAPGTHRPR